MVEERTLWLAFGAAAAISAGIVARRGAAAAWRYTRHEEPPVNADDRQASWKSLLLWAGISGFCVAFARVAGRGAANRAWRHALGRNPPDQV